MSLFFLVVGLEVKRELLTGELRDPQAAVLPVVAALGGMVVPALLYLAVNTGGEGSSGWGIADAHRHRVRPRRPDARGRGSPPRA